MTRAVVIGGSAGSFRVVMQIVNSLPKNLQVPVIICLHRLKSARTGFVETLRIKTNLPVVEPFDKDPVLPGRIYVAPANHHLMIESDGTFSLSVEEPFNHSRPSIDLTFFSAAEYWKENLLGLILSGANFDGAFGLGRIRKNGGLTIIQDPIESEVPVMPESCIEIDSAMLILPSNQIIEKILTFVCQKLEQN